MRSFKVSVAVAALVSAMPGFAIAQDAVQVDGSSTVFPVSEAMAEEFQIATGNRVVVGVSGTGGGFQKFCRGETSFSGASRPIATSEVEECAANDIEFVELPIAMDALAVIVNPANDWATCMTVEDLKTIYEPEAQGTVDNWSQVNEEYPDRPLSIFGAGTDSGTYDYFTFAIVGEEGASRGDFTATEDDNITIQGVSTDEEAIGFLGLAYVEENRDTVKAVEISYEGGECVAPSTETAADGSYQPLTRPLFMYANAAHLEEMPAVEEFAKFFFNEDTASELVASTGYLPLPDEAYSMAVQKIDNRNTGSYFDGGSEIGVTVEQLLSAN